jgi:hypothetical protein
VNWLDFAVLRRSGVVETGFKEIDYILTTKPKVPPYGLAQAASLARNEAAIFIENTS